VRVWLNVGGAAGVDVGGAGGAAAAGAGAGAAAGAAALTAGAASAFFEGSGATFSAGFSAPFETGAGAGFGGSASGFFAARDAQLRAAGAAGAGAAAAVFAGAAAAAAEAGAAAAAEATGAEVDATGCVTASAFFSALACGFSSLFFSLGFGSSGFVTSFMLAGAEADAAGTTGAGVEPVPPGTNGCASLGSGLLDSAAGTKGAAVGAKENENCPPPPPPGTNSQAPGLKENSLAFGLSGMDYNAPGKAATSQADTSRSDRSFLPTL